LGQDHSAETGGFVRTDWQVLGSCNEIGTDVWFPPKGASPKSGAVKALIAICDGCLVKSECLSAALEMEGDCGRESRHGIWGGTLPGERHRMAKGPRKPRIIRDDNLCPKGLHEMTPDNVYVHPSSHYRECHACKLARRKDYQQRRAG
jgi:hypothetical protein